MMYLKLLLLLLFSFLFTPPLISLVKEQSPENWKIEVDSIDQTVDRLTDLRNKELARAARAQNQGDRLQFNNQNLVDARRYWNEADSSREIAARYQQEIDQLELRKQEILRKQGG
ncbi:MAG: hypothetical protein HYZ47_01160 [Simkania negevensis]|nr:hypothetical protein [Simkania negevensis]